MTYIILLKVFSSISLFPCSYVGGFMDGWLAEIEGMKLATIVQGSSVRVKPH
jgi:hypothetical protein